MFDAYTLTKKVCPKNVQDFEERSTKRKRFRNVLVGYVKYGRPNNVEDLQKQGFYRFLRKTYILHPTALAIVLYATGGLPFVVWGMVTIIFFSFLFLFIVHMISLSLLLLFVRI